MRTLLFGEYGFWEYFYVQLAKLKTKEWWVRKAKLMALPMGCYLYGLQPDPWDGHYKYYMMRPPTEWAIGKELFNAQFNQDSADAPRLLKGGEIELLLNDILQHVLEKNGINNGE